MILPHGAGEEPSDALDLWSTLSLHVYSGEQRCQRAPTPENLRRMRELKETLAEFGEWVP